MSMRFRVVREDTIHEFEFDRERVTVGRGPSNDVVLEDSAVARRHGAFERQPDGSLVWSCTAPTAFRRAGAEVDRTSSDEPRRWALVDGDIVEIDGSASAIAIEVLTAESAPTARPYFVELTPVADAVGPVLIDVARQMAVDSGPGAVLEAFRKLLQHSGVAGGRATLVVLSGANEYHNEAWTFGDEGCGPTPDPTSVMGAATDDIAARWRTSHCIAVIGDEALVPIGEGTLDALIVYRLKSLSPEVVRTLSAAASALRPFAHLFVTRLRAEREHGALVEENRYFRARQRQHYLFKELVCESRAMRAVHDRLKQMRNEDRPVLFAGEAGTGKELLARLLHHESPRTEQMLMRVNCAEYADETANFELFGSSADDRAAGPRKGVFELARQGTVLLEEIDVLQPMVQAKLCRALKENEVRRIGESVGRPVGARLIASVHRDVSECVAEGRLRRDLYMMFRDQTIVVPSLRDRREDILPLARKFLGVYAARYGRHVDGFSAEAETRMMDHFWPGNVRELQARVEASVLGTNGPRVGVAQLGLS